MEKKIQQSNHVDEFFFQLYLCVESNGVKIMNIVNVFNLTIDAINKGERKIIQKNLSCCCCSSEAVHFSAIRLSRSIVT